jgi:hypothetical protein
MLRHIDPNSIERGLIAMSHNNKTAVPGMLTLAEIKEFASFSAATQRYVRRSLDVAFDRIDAIAIWSRDDHEAASIQAQHHYYDRLPEIRALIPNSSDFEDAEIFLSALITVSAFDLGQGRIDSFGGYRFLYERLIAADARPWLPAAFCAAASMPHLPPERRKMLLQSISEAAATAPGWSKRAPSFYPEWIEKVEAEHRAS